MTATLKSTAHTTYHMDEVYGVDPERAWGGALLAGVLALVAGALAFPRQIYDEFLWRYFWGPVVADAYGAPCAIRADGETTIASAPTDCTVTAGIVAEPGYTTLSTVSYAVVLIFMLIGVIFLLRRLDVGDSPRFFFALFPFMLFGGALRVVEDANVALMDTGGPTIPFPWSGFLISPLIYFTVFFVTVAALVASVLAEHRGLVDRYEYPLAGFGTLTLAVTFAYLGWLVLTTDVLGFQPLVPLITLIGATLITWVVWVVTQRATPVVNAGTGLMGALVIWGHTVDGVANVLSLDWSSALGIPSYSPKHVVNAAIIDITGSIQPEWLSELIGTAWPFLPVKVLAATLVVYVFDDQIFEDSPRYAMILLVAILAVGLGPGTRDFLRATFGI
jgi:uncharacterized membrane protein